MGFATIGIVGLGLMGGSLALALRQARPELTVIGCDRDPLAARRAMDRGAVAIAGTDLDAVRAADLIVLAVPVLAMRSLFGELAGSQAVITDVASTKGQVLRWAAAAGVDLIGGHPMCGREASGLDAASPDLFRGAPWVLTRREPAVEEIARAVGALPVVMDAERHDQLVAGVSHAAFMVSVAYLLGVAGGPDWPEMSRIAASGFRDMSRLAGGDPEMYAGIALTNPEHIGAALDAVIAQLQRLRRHLDHRDARVAELFEEARTIRRRWEEERRQGARS